MSIVGVATAGIAVPASRIPLATIQQAWQNVPADVVARNGVSERAVLEPDQDVITLAAEAAERALRTYDGPPIGALLLGTQTSPYLTRSAAAIVADMLGLGRDIFTADVQFSGKSGTAALRLAVAWVSSGQAEAALAIGADTLAAHAAPGDPMEYVAGSGAGALVVANAPGAATVDAAASVSSDTPDGFRLDGERYIRTGGTVMTGTSVGYQDHAEAAWRALGAEVADVDAAVLSQPDGAVPAKIGRRLGFTPAQLERGLVAPRIGDAGAASCLIGLARVLETATMGERIAVVSYGVGAGSDALLLTATGTGIDAGTDEALGRRLEVDYPTAVRYERRYAGHDRLVGTFE